MLPNLGAGFDGRRVAEHERHPENFVVQGEVVGEEEVVLAERFAVIAGDGDDGVLFEPELGDNRVVLLPDPVETPE